MTLLSRRVVTSKSYDAVSRIIKGCAYRFSKSRFSEDGFSMHCAKRYNGGVISTIPVKGSIEQRGNVVQVTLMIQANIGFCLCCLILLLGIIDLLICLFACSPNWISGVGIILFGIFLCGQYVWEGKDILDRLEHRIMIG